MRRPGWACGGLALAAGLACASARAAGPPVLDVGELLAMGRALSPARQAAILDTDAASARARGAGTLDDPTLTDTYQYYKDPGVFSGHAVMLTQAFPLWGKRDLRRQAALADVDAARGRERAATDALDERIKVAFAQYVLVTRDTALNRELSALASQMRGAMAARYGQGTGDQGAVIAAMVDETTARTDAARLAGDRESARVRLNILVGRASDAPLAEPRARTMPATMPPLAELLDRALARNANLAATGAEMAAARTRGTLADRARLPDLTLGGGPLVQTNNRPTGFAATIGVNIPLLWGREQAAQAEAAGQLGAARKRDAAQRLEIEGALAEALARLRAARTTAHLLRTQAMPYARSAAQSVLASYAQGRGDIGAAITARRRLPEVERQMLQAELDEQTEFAVIERLIGGDL